MHNARLVARLVADPAWPHAICCQRQVASQTLRLSSWAGVATTTSTCKPSPSPHTLFTLLALTGVIGVGSRLMVTVSEGRQSCVQICLTVGPGHALVALAMLVVTGHAASKAGGALGRWPYLFLDHPNSGAWCVLCATRYGHLHRKL